MLKGKWLSIVLGLLNVIFGLLIGIRGKEQMHFAVIVVIIGVITLFLGFKKKND